MIEIENLTKTYTQGGEKLHILQNLQHTIADGTSSAILGQSGSGKSTLLNLIAGLDGFDSGELRLFGSNFSKMTLAERSQVRQKFIGIVFQQFYLMPYLNVIENVTLPLEIMRVPNPLSKAMSVLEEVGLSHRKTHLPHQLSGGESQRVAIARAIVVEPKILLADEPTGNLDEKNGDIVLDLLFRVHKKMKNILIVVTHNRDLAARCETRLELRKGELHVS